MIAEFMLNFLSPSGDGFAAHHSIGVFGNSKAIRSQISLAPESSPPPNNCKLTKVKVPNCRVKTESALLKASQSLGPLVFMKSGSTWGGHPATKETSWRNLTLKLGSRTDNLFPSDTKPHA